MVICGYGFTMFLSRIWDEMVKCVVKPVRQLKTRLLCAFWGIEAAEGVLFNGPVFIRTRRSGQVKLGKNVRFNSTIRANSVGLVNPTIINVRLGGELVIGEGSGLSSPVLSSKSRIEIGHHAYIGGNVRIFDHDFHALKPEERRDPVLAGNVRTRPITIGDEVFIGANAMILKGTHIGDRSIVAAGSVVFGLDVPPDSMVKGNPAVVCGRRRI